MSNQLIKETALGREQVFPKNYILNLKDKDSGANLKDILKSFNMLFLPYLGNKVDTRKQVPISLRHGGLWITYIVNSTVVTEWYNSTAVDDYTWGSDTYWREGSNMLVGDISISKQGTWVINGEDTGISPKGDKGDSPVIRIYNNRIQVSYDNGVTYEDLNNTPVFTLFRFNSNTNTHLVSYDLGLTWQDVLPDKVYYKFRYNESTNTYLVSTDLGKTWSNVSAEKVFYQFRFNTDTNTHLVSTDLGSNWVDISSEKVFYKFRTNENKLQVSTDLGTTWEDCSEPIAAWFRWVSGDTADSVGKLLISRDELKTWTDLSPNIVNNLRIKGYVAAVGNLPSNAALGDIYMVGPTYDESDSTHNYPHYRMWVKLSSGWVDNGEYLSNVLMSLTTGLETGITMSLKAITDSIAAETARAKAAEEANADKISVLDLDINSGISRSIIHITIAESGKYVNNGHKYESPNTFYSAPIKLTAGVKYIYRGKGYGANISMISQSNAEGGQLGTLVQSVDSTLRDYEFIPQQNMYVVLSGFTNTEYSFSKVSEVVGLKQEVETLKQDVEALESEATQLQVTVNDNSEDINNLNTIVITGGEKSSIIPITIAERDKYINKGNKYESPNFFYSVPILLDAGVKYIYHGKGYQANVSMISQSNAEGGQLGTLVQSVDSTLRDYEFTPQENMYVVLSGMVNVEYSFSKVSEVVGLEQEVEELKSNFNEIAKAIDVPPFALFQKFAVLGDSYASGELYSSSTQLGDFYNISWGQILARKNGCECINMSRGGQTTKGWLTDSTRGYGLLQSSEAQQLYICAFGLNDKNYLTLGSLSDIHIDEPSLNEDTFYGNYGKIISAIKTKAPNARIVMSTMAKNTPENNFLSYNVAIEEMSELFNVMLIKQYDDEYFKSSFYINNMEGGHPNAVSYSYMAKAIENMICTLMKDRASYFKHAGIVE